MRTVRTLLMAMILALPSAGGAADVQLQIIDREQETSPPVARAAAPCNVAGFAQNLINLNATSVAATSRAQGSVQGGDCDDSNNSFALQQFNVNLIGAPGATAQLCYVVRFAGATSADGPPGNVDALAQIGGNPASDPGGVFLNGNPVATFQEYFLPNESDSETQRALFTATVGDVLRFETGVRTFAGLTGAGAANSSGEAFAAVYVGGCPSERAPTASPWGLLGLAGALATFGAAMLRRRA